RLQSARIFPFSSRPSSAIRSSLFAAITSPLVDLIVGYCCNSPLTRGEFQSSTPRDPASSCLKDRCFRSVMCARADHISFVQHDAQERIVDLDSPAIIALVINETEFLELIHE